jgi:hypothetical protein
MSDSLVSRDGASTDDYVARDTRKHKRITSSPRALMKGALISEAQAPDAGAPNPAPVIPDETVQDNLRRIKASAANTLITINPDGTRSYKHDLVVRDGDGIRDTLATDRGHGVTDSIERLRSEKNVKVAGLLSKSGRDTSGRFTKGGK